MESFVAGKVVPTGPKDFNQAANDTYTMLMADQPDTAHQDQWVCIYRTTKIVAKK